MAKFVGKFRQNRDYSEDDEFGRNSSKNKKRKKEQYREMRKMKLRNYEDDNFSNEQYEPSKRMKLY